MGVLGRIELGAVGLSVGSLERSLAFYQDAIGMRVLEQAGERAVLGVDEPAAARARGARRRQARPARRRPLSFRAAAADARSARPRAAPSARGAACR